MTKPDRATWLPLRRMLRSWGEKIFIVVALVAMTIGLTRIDLRASRPGHGLEPTNSRLGRVVRSNVVHVWLPEPLLDLVDHRSELSADSTYQELRTSLERRGLQNVWYALTTRDLQINGRVAETTYIRYPYLDPDQFLEFLEVLATGAGNPPRDHAFITPRPRFTSCPRSC